MRYSAFLVLLLLAPASAWACWDGLGASDGPICISWASSDGSIPFTLEGAHAAAESIRRLRPLLRRGETLDVIFGGYESSCGDMADDDSREPRLHLCERSGACQTLLLEEGDLSMKPKG